MSSLSLSEILEVHDRSWLLARGPYLKLTGGMSLRADAVIKPWDGVIGGPWFRFWL